MKFRLRPVSAAVRPWSYSELVIIASSYFAMTVLTNTLKRNMERLTEISNPERAVFNTLTEIEQIVVKMRFGIDQADQRAYKLQEIADYFSLSRERIRQILAKAMRKLKHPSRMKLMELWLKEFQG